MANSLAIEIVDVRKCLIVYHCLVIFLLKVRKGLVHSFNQLDPRK